MQQQGSVGDIFQVFRAPCHCRAQGVALSLKGVIFCGRMVGLTRAAISITMGRL